MVRAEVEFSRPAPDYQFAFSEYEAVLAYPGTELYDLALFKSAWALWTRTRVMLYQRDFGRMHEVLDADWERMRRARRWLCRHPRTKPDMFVRFP